ncbi:MAG: LPS export ABC transporter permease LptF, partial [Pseudomonadota bacterium]
RLPGFVELILPLGFFLSILLVFGRMYMDNEITILHAGGVSRNKLSAYILGISLFMVLLVGVVSCFLTPIGASKFHKIWNDPNNFRGLSTLIEGKFQSNRGTGWVSYTEELSPDKTKLGLVFMGHPKQKGDEHEVIMVAQKGRVVERSNGRFIELDKGVRYEGNPGQKDYQITEFEQLGQLIEVSVKHETEVSSESMSTAALWQSNKPEDRAIFHWRLGIPISLWIMSLLAFALSKTDPRRGRFVALLPALVLYVMYVFAMSAGKNALGEGKLPLWMGLWWLHALFLALTLAVLYLDSWKRWLASLRAQSLHHGAAS